MATLQAFKDDETILFDTSLICYGLVKSGNMALQQYWSRRFKRSAQLDPNDGANWWPVVVAPATGAPEKGSRSDQIWGFTIYNALSPICFITGPGTHVGSSVSGNAFTFFYANSSAATKFYCFDLMGDNLLGSPFLKTYDTTGRITFNSLQPPLNVIGAYSPPAPPAVNDERGRKLMTYNGGRVQKRQYVSADGGLGSQMDSIIDIALSAGVEYAAFLPWSRSANLIETNPTSSSTGPATQYGASEGAHGRVGGISFMFGAAAGTNEAYPGGMNSAPVSYANIPTDRFPTALVIATANLPFPYN
ncbi:hypothetical protein [Pseudomonas brassicacearum]|uniref:Uncharacterized protein n=1 Tax=Pseudomonas brassicacearum TaxID=930166 RepID=A0A423H081_9PSED|nr:hypothetical protein [Pseudomonas brassicacearum]RON05136.1 hypothetical protein BK658_02205 [Pseudomonas brassicacearum]